MLINYLEEKKTKSTKKSKISLDTLKRTSFRENWLSLDSVTYVVTLQDIKERLFRRKVLYFLERKRIKKYITYT